MTNTKGIIAAVIMAATWTGMVICWAFQWGPYR